MREGPLVRNILVVLVGKKRIWMILGGTLMKQLSKIDEVRWISSAGPCEALRAVVEVDA